MVLGVSRIAIFRNSIDSELGESVCTTATAQLDMFKKAILLQAAKVFIEHTENII